ncbi:uncharacterized protein [Ptychodera flava]|uniref:uncharacterized protein n=1 Tax=Ptychodera flava TaxID=63121 RepID=UPI003969D3A1
MIGYGMRMRRQVRFCQRRVSFNMAFSGNDSCIDDIIGDFPSVWEDLPEMEGKITPNSTEVFCICNGVETSTMIACDSPKCTVEWFHYGCVGLTAESIPDGSWICPKCSGKEVNQDMGTEKSFENEDSGKTPKTRKSIKVKCTSSYTLEDALSSSEKLMKTATEEIIRSPKLRLNRQRAKEMEPVLKMLTSSNGSKELSSFLIERVWQSISFDEISPQSLENMCSAFHGIRLDDEIENEFLAFLSCNEISISSRTVTFLVQFLLTQLMKLLLQAKCNGINCTTLDNGKVDGLSKDEEQVLRYVSGFIPHKLICFYRRHQGNKSAQACLAFLETLRTNAGNDTSISFLNYTKKWVELLNRGGLFQVDDSFYLFMKKVEEVAKPHLDLQNVRGYKDTNLKSVILTTLQKSVSVINGWHVLSQGFNHTLSQSLFIRVLECYVDIRCQSYASIYMYLRKKKDEKLSRKGEKSFKEKVMLMMFPL